MSGEILHQPMMVIAACEARLVPSEVMPRVHLGNHQGNRRAMTDTMGSDLPGACGDVMKAAHYQVALGIQSPGSLIRRKLESLQFLRQGCDKRRKESLGKA
jgi:hypothetical protein